MTATVEQTKSDLSQMIRLAISGEEIVITEQGRPVAKLTGISQPALSPNRKQWLDSLDQLRESTTTGKARSSAEQIFSEDRTERD